MLPTLQLEDWSGTVWHFIAYALIVYNRQNAWQASLVVCWSLAQWSQLPNLCRVASTAELIEGSSKGADRVNTLMPTSHICCLDLILDMQTPCCSACDSAEHSTCDKQTPEQRPPREHNWDYDKQEENMRRLMQWLIQWEQQVQQPEDTTYGLLQPDTM